MFGRLISFNHGRHPSLKLRGGGYIWTDYFHRHFPPFRRREGPWRLSNKPWELVEGVRGNLKVLWDAVEGPWAIEGSGSGEAVWESFEGTFGVRDTAGRFWAVVLREDRWKVNGAGRVLGDGREVVWDFWGVRNAVEAFWEAPGEGWVCEVREIGWTWDGVRCSELALEGGWAVGERLFMTIVLPLMSIFWAFAKRFEPKYWKVSRPCGIGRIQFLSGHNFWRKGLRIVKWAFYIKIENQKRKNQRNLKMKRKKKTAWRGK